jgi:hypothetical protein
MAGYLSDERKWCRYEREWRHVLQEYRIGSLHMKKFAHSQGEFAGWPESKRVALLQQLIAIIKSRVLYRVGAVVPCADYDQTVGAADPGDDRRSPFWLCFLSCFSAIMAYCRKEQIGDDIAVVLDQNNESNAHALGFYSSFKELPDIPNRDQLVSLSFADDKKINPLQAADLLAYELNKYHQGFDRKPLRALEGTPGVFAVWNRKMLEDYVVSLHG